jgi:acyl-CoA synthetase (NDP forming)
MSFGTVAERRPNVKGMLSPKSVAVIGASEKPGSVGRALTENLRSFGGRVFVLNPNHGKEF